jgi:uncharacterized protein (DUF58 family)
MGEPLARTPGWAPTRALGRAVLLAGVLVLLGTLLGRLDLIALATPFALGTALALRRRPAQAPGVDIGLAEETVEEGGGAGVTVVLANPTQVRFDVAVIRLVHSPWLTLRHGDRPYSTDLAANQVTQVDLAGSALRWGRHGVGPVRAYALACDGLMLSATTLHPGREVRVHPRMPAFRADETMPRSAALVGVHRSRRPGEGGELAGVRRYGPGDRLRRIDWRITLRTRELHVAHTLSDRDAEVVVLLDVLYEAGRSGGIHGTASVVDTSVRAAAAIAEHYLRLGDRVAMLEFSGHPRHLRPASGRWQLQAALEWLLSTRATAGSGDPPDYGIEPSLIPPSALVIVLTPMIGPQSANMIATLARAGRAVVAVDTMGELTRQPVYGSQWTPIAQRLWRLERDNTIGALREVGVPVVGWVGSGSLDEVLQDMARMASAPRVSLR